MIEDTWTWDEIGISTVCMNRALYVRQAVKTWVQFPFKEIVILDWYSKQPLSYKMFPDDERIKLYRWDGNGDLVWRAGQAMGTAVRLTTTRMVLKLDCDIKVLKPVPLSVESGSFYRGVRRSKAGDITNISARLYGSWLAPRARFDAVNGFNERFTGWGHEDTDLYSRMTEQGGKKLPFDDNVLYHIPHDSTIRQGGGMFGNYDVPKWTLDDVPFDHTQARLVQPWQR